MDTPGTHSPSDDTHPIRKSISRCEPIKDNFSKSAVTNQILSPIPSSIKQAITAGRQTEQVCISLGLSHLSDEWLQKGGRAFPNTSYSKPETATASFHNPVISLMSVQCL